MSLSLYTSAPFTYPGGGIASGVLVSVYFAATSVHVQIFHDDLGTTPKTNPTRTDDTGRVSFWIEPGDYVLFANKTRIPITVASIPDPPGPNDYVTRSEVENMIAAAGGSSLPPVMLKGQLYAATGAGAMGLLNAGTNGQVLSADSAAATGLRWIDAASGGGAVASVFGRTGAVVAQAGDYTKSQVGLGNVDNTADTAKPVSTAQQTALNLKEDITAHNADIAGRQPLDSDLTTIAGLAPTNSDTLQFIAGAWANRTPAQTKATLAIAEADVANLVADLAAKQPLDADLTTIAGLTATTDNLIQSVAGAWASRTPAQLKATLGLVKGDVGLGNVDNTSDATKFAGTTLTGTTTANRLVITPDALSVVGGAVATDVSLGNHFEFTANANFTLSNPTNPSHGQRVLWAITQDATGSRIITLGAAFALGTDITSVVLSTAANKTDLLGAVYDSPSGKWRVCMFTRGY